MPSAANNGRVWPFTQIKPFTDYLLVECGLAKNTILAYQHDLSRFAKYCHEESLTDPKKLSAILVQQFAKRLSQDNLASSSIARHLAAVRMFLKYHMLNGLLDKDVWSAIESPKTWQLLPRVLGKQQTLELIGAVDEDNRYCLRDRALLELLYATGIRASEAAGLSLSDINFQIEYLRCLGKGNKERIIPVHAEALNRLKDYIENLRPELVGHKPVSALFVSRTGRPLSRIEIWRIVQRAAQRVGMAGKVSPHTLRHCFGSHLLQGGAGLRNVQEMLGHADVTTTQIYTHIDSQHLRDIHKKYHPRN